VALRNRNGNLRSHSRHSDHHNAYQTRQLRTRFRSNLDFRLGHSSGNNTVGAHGPGLGASETPIEAPRRPKGDGVWLSPPSFLGFHRCRWAQGRNVGPIDFCTLAPTRAFGKFSITSTPKEREIFGYLLVRDERSFNGAVDGGHAQSLRAEAILFRRIVCACPVKGTCKAFDTCPGSHHDAQAVSGRRRVAVIALGQEMRTLCAVQ
jgi:hypothetical protein